MSKVNCPYCGSVQVKAMANQPKKYPRPSDPAALQDWQRGFDCKKCGNDFVLLPPKPKKPLGFFGKLVKWFFIIIIALLAIGYFFGDDKPKNKETPKEQKVQVVDKTSQPDPSKEEFSKEAEEAAHAYIPQLDKNQPKSIRGSDNQNDTLNIETTIRESN